MKKFVLMIQVVLLTTAANAAVVITQLPNRGIGISGDQSYAIDFDLDGLSEITVSAIGGTQFSITQSSNVRLQSILAAFPNIGSRAVPLQSGDIIGATLISPATWNYDSVGTSTLRACTDFTCVGNWPNGSFTEFDPVTGLIAIYPESGYLGVEFTNSSGKHFGWVDIGVYSFSPTGRVYGWGYETLADTPVMIVPEANIGILSMIGLTSLIYRRRR